MLTCYFSFIQIPPPGQQQQQPQHDPMMDLNEDGSAKAPAAFIQAVRANADMMAAIQHGNPALAAAIRNEDIPAMQVGHWFATTGSLLKSWLLPLRSV
jgi:hypothetical protein